MTDPDHTDHAIRQGRALVKAIEGLSEIDPSGPVERLMIGMLLESYKQRLRTLVELLPAWAMESILGASEHSDEDSPAMWVSWN